MLEGSCEGIEICDQSCFKQETFFIDFAEVIGRDSWRKIQNRFNEKKFTITQEDAFTFFLLIQCSCIQLYNCLCTIKDTCSLFFPLYFTLPTLFSGIRNCFTYPWNRCLSYIFKRSNIIKNSLTFMIKVKYW